MHLREGKFYIQHFIKWTDPANINNFAGIKPKTIPYDLQGTDLESFDFEKYEVGGCCVTPEDDKYKCSKCEYSW